MENIKNENIEAEPIKKITVKKNNKKNLTWGNIIWVTIIISFLVSSVTGLAFGFLSSAGGWQNIFFIIVAGAASAFILWMIRRLDGKERLLAIALMLVLGGALGNLADRLIHGYVIDFIDVYYATWHWPAFNVADSAITVGAGLVIADGFRGKA